MKLSFEWLIAKIAMSGLMGTLARLSALNGHIRGLQLCMYIAMQENNVDDFYESLEDLSNSIDDMEKLIGTMNLKIDEKVSLYMETEHARQWMFKKRQQFSSGNA